MIGFAFLISSIAVSATAPQTTYTVTIPAAKDVAHMEIAYTPTEETLSTVEGAFSTGPEGGLAHFIENVTASRADGTPITVENPAPGKWQLAGTSGQPITVRYDVRLEHDNYKWTYGVEAIAYNRDDCVFFVSHTLLLRIPGLTSARVKIVAPDSWKIATSWTPVDGQPFTYDVTGQMDLLNTCVIAGDFVQSEIQAADSTITLAIGHDLAPYADVFDKDLRACVGAFGKLFNHNPNTRFVAVLNVNKVAGTTNGNAFPRGVSMLTPRRVESTNFVQAMYTLAHEVLHMWNGYGMKPNGQMDWFMEGFTDYLTWRTMMSEHLIDEQALLVQFRRQLNAYIHFDHTVSIADSGQRKANNKPLVYDGGSLTALCLDAMIRRHSSGERGLADFMREMYARTTLQGKGYDNSVIVSVATEFAGDDFKSFFDRYVAGTEILPLDDCLGEMGIKLKKEKSNGEVSVEPMINESAKGRVAKNRDYFFGRS